VAWHERGQFDQRPVPVLGQYVGEAGGTCLRCAEVEQHRRLRVEHRTFTVDLPSGERQPRVEPGSGWLQADAVERPPAADDPPVDGRFRRIGTVLHPLDVRWHHDESWAAVQQTQHQPGQIRPVDHPVAVAAQRQHPPMPGGVDLYLRVAARHRGVQQSLVGGPESPAHRLGLGGGIVDQQHPAVSPAAGGQPGGQRQAAEPASGDDGVELGRVHRTLTGLRERR
jgi:hypothetical protein